MQKFFLLFLTFLFMVSTPGAAHAAPLQDTSPVVHAILFWSNGCPYCAEVLTDTLPPIQDKYNSQLSILMVEVVTVQDIDNLYNLGTALGLTKGQVLVPFMLIDHKALIGAKDISDNLPGLIDEYLSSGVEYPDLPVVSEMIPKGVLFTTFKPEAALVQQSASDSNALGMGMAWAIMVFMIVVLAVSIVMILRAFNGKSLRTINPWLDLAIPLLSLIGLGASIYLTYVEMTHSRALCGPVGDCNAVQSSPYAKLFGLIPIGLVGAIGYIAILASWLWKRYRTDSLSQIAGPVMFGMALFGTLFSIYLTYLEIFVIHAVCIWCLSSAVIISTLMLLNLPPITQWLAISDEEE